MSWRVGQEVMSRPTWKSSRLSGRVNPFRPGLWVHRCPWHRCPCRSLNNGYRFWLDDLDQKVSFYYNLAAGLRHSVAYWGPGGVNRRSSTFLVVTRLPVDVRVVIFIIGPSRLHAHSGSVVHTVVDVPTYTHAYLQIIIPVRTIPLWVTQSRPAKSYTGRPKCVCVCARTNPSLSILPGNIWFISVASWLEKMQNRCTWSPVKCVDSDWPSLPVMLRSKCSFSDRKQSGSRKLKLQSKP